MAVTMLVVNEKGEGKAYLQNRSSSIVVSVDCSQGFLPLDGREGLVELLKEFGRPEDVEGGAVETLLRVCHVVELGKLLEVVPDPVRFLAVNALAPEAVLSKLSFCNVHTKNQIVWSL